jgi:catechol 2,3-dioxygenase-like lactoylglutathione lyase family enzyme
MPAILQNHYVLAVPNVRQSAKFYVDALGFTVTADPAGWIFLSKDHCTIMLGECPDDVPPSQLGSHNYFAYLRVDDADAWYAQLQPHGVQFLSAATNQPWGMREFAIKTPDGHRIMFGQTLRQ